MVHLRIALILILYLPANAFSACDAETIQFYLDKGFSQEQITKLCAEASESSPTYQPYQKPIVIYQEGGHASGNSAEERKAINEIKGAIDGRSVDVTDDRINYIRNLCLLAGNSKEIDQRGKKCIDVAFSIARKGLTVTKSGRGLILFGQVELEVGSSDIKRKTVTADPWDSFSPDIRFALKRKYDATQTGNFTTIPIRRSASTGQVVNALKTLAAATELQNSEHNNEVARVLDDSYVPPTEEEYLAANPIDKEEKEEKKKKKWWNPFD